MLKTFYQALKATIVAGAPSIQHVGWYNRNDIESEEQPRFQLPAVLIEFGTINLSSQTKRHQQFGASRFRLHVVTAIGNEKEDPELPALEATDEVYASIQGKSCNLSGVPGSGLIPGATADHVVFNTVNRKSISGDHSAISVMVTVQDFECTVYDITDIHPRTLITASPQVTALIPS